RVEQRVVDAEVVQHEVGRLEVFVGGDGAGVGEGDDARVADVGVAGVDFEVDGAAVEAAVAGDGLELLAADVGDGVAVDDHAGHDGHGQGVCGVRRHGASFSP